MRRLTAGSLLPLLGALGCTQATPLDHGDDSVASLAVTPLQAIVTGGERVHASAVARNANDFPVTPELTWSTGDAGVATVAANGDVTATGNGTTTITVSSGNLSASFEITVEPPGLRRIVDSVRRAYGLPAMGGAIVTRAGTEALAVSGTRRVDRGPFVTVADKWHIGSNLKAITAALAAIAVDEGKLAWSTTVATAFPELGVAIMPKYRTVTLEQLLSHQGGIRNDPPLGAFLGETQRAQRESLATWALTAPSSIEVGTFEYSNPGYVIAGAMIERALDGTFEDLLQDRLLGPLGADGLGWGAAAQAGSTDQPVGHSYQNGTWVPCEGCDNPPGLSSAGRAHIPLGSWARVIRELLDADAGAGTLIGGNSGRSLFTSRITLNPTDGYALGWFVTTRPWAAGRVAAHDGSNTVNHSVAWLGLDRGIGFLAVTNAADLQTGRSGAALDALVGRMITLHDSGK
jgi:CubicO group peptidase (beta-lactamase class C family)